MMRKKLPLISVALTLAMTALIIVLGGCQTTQNQNGKSTRHIIVVYSFSVEEEVMNKEIFPAFKKYWQQRAGEEVIFQSIFTGSEEIADAIVEGGLADVAILSNEQHAVWLNINDFVETDWQSFPHQGIVTESPLVIAVRPGNPLGIKDWADLVQPGVKLVHANPQTSGGAQWALLAEYGSALMAGASQEAAKEQLRDIWANVIASPSSSREALKEFLFGVGDALITYEQDALLAQSRGACLELITPSRTVLSEHVAVLVDHNIDRWESEIVNAFVSFLWSETAQNAFTRYYFRPVTAEALEALAADNASSTGTLPSFPEIEQPFTVQDLGGWGQVYPEIIRGIWEEQIAPQP
jgi:sulfate transport system substrate-binding protein